ncbi:J domain-containing protein [Leptolyngbya ohadii]|uniref:J domain-containing protein n=1 Tax=Leptolyngbya ohadii TaxID=1962290 RepID=UPI000B5A1378|nr:J domain-containing protein [Leptolyngbya ohadii]
MTETLSENQRTATYYELLKLHPSASPQQIRQAFRDLSKLYHPDTTALPPAIATAQFQQLNEAYATLSNPDRRFAYDRKIGYSRFTVIQPPADLNKPVSAARKYRSSAYLDPNDRPLSGGELFALFILGLTFIGCFALAVAIAYARGGSALQMIEPPATVLKTLLVLLQP